MLGQPLERRSRGAREPGGRNAPGPLVSSISNRRGPTANTMLETDDLDWLIAALKGVGAAVLVTILVALLTVWL